MRFLFVYPNSIKYKAHAIGVAVLAAILRENGHEVGLFDTTFLAAGEEAAAFIPLVDEFQPDMIGYSIRTADFKLAEQLQRRIADRGIPSVAGGVHATLAPEQTADTFGLVLRGECEVALPILVDLVARQQDLSEAPNLCYPDAEGQYHTNDLAPLVTDLDSLPFPYWQLFDLRHFTEGDNRSADLEEAACSGNFERSRGCPYQCTYCSIPALRKMYRGKGRWTRQKSVERLVEEIKAFCALYPLEFFFFVDDTFLPHKIEDMRRIRDLFRDRLGAIPFSIAERPERITVEKLRLFKEAGGRKVWIGVESGDDDLRRGTLKRNMTNETLVAAFAAGREAGVAVRSLAMVGLPNQDDESYLRTYELMGRLQPDDAVFTIFVPFLGTELYDHCLDNGYIDPDDTFNITTYHVGSPLHMPGISGRKIVRYQKLFYHLQGEYSTFKRQLVKWGGRYESAFLPIFMFFMLPRILRKNRQWFRERGIFGAMRKAVGYYRTGNS